MIREERRQMQEMACSCSHVQCSHMLLTGIVDADVIVGDMNSTCHMFNEVCDVQILHHLNKTRSSAVRMCRCAVSHGT